MRGDSGLSVILKVELLAIRQVFLKACLVAVLC